jgi:hypothetical protein
MQEALEAMSVHESRRSEQGFALILAILALMLLTFLGLTLATTTSTELQIATNYRWSQQARYNAEAGVEVAKSMLRSVDWATLIPAARTATPWNGTTAPTVAGGGAVALQTRNDEWGNASRNFENWECDARGNGVGYGVVLDDGGAAGPVQYRSTSLGQNLNGAFTIWVRRPTEPIGNTGQLRDYNQTDALVIVSEGIAPFNGGNAGSAFGQANMAVQVVEAVLSRQVLNAANPCGTRAGQTGGGPEGANFSGCDPITGPTGLTALGPASTGGRGTQNDNGGVQ